MAQNRGLGKGLSALIPGVTTKVSQNKIDNTIIEIPLVKIVPNKNQPRTNFNEDTIKELADSIKTFGLIQPIIVRSIDKGKMYEIISGERRYRAFQMLGLNTIPCLINQNVDDLVSLEMALIENIQRDDLSPIELAHTFKQLIDEFNLTHDELSKRIGKSRTAITNSLRLLLLPLEIQKMVNEEIISAGHARALLSIESKEEQIKLAEKIAINDLSVRETEKLVGEINKKLTKDISTFDNKNDLKIKKDLNLLQLNKLPILEKTVSDFLDAPVKIKVSKTKGKIEIMFGSVKDFERIINKIISQQ